MRPNDPSSRGRELPSEEASAEALREARALLSKYVSPGRSLVQELIDERRREQRREDERTT